MRVEIPEILPSLNQQQGHWTIRKRLKNRWFLLLRQAVPVDCWQKQKPHKFKITIVRYSPRLLDIDNFIGGHKLLIDLLKSRVLKRFPCGQGKFKMKVVIVDGLIYDDSPRYLEVKYLQWKGKSKTVIIRG